MADEPNFDALVDKAFGAPPPAEADNSQPEVPPTPSPADTPSAAPAANEDGVDGSVILMRADYSRKMHELGEQRRALEAERQRLASLQELADRLDNDESFRGQFENAWQQAQSGVQPSAPSAPNPHLARIDRLERHIAQQAWEARNAAVDAAQNRIAAEYGMSKKDTEAVIQKAIDAGVLHDSTPNARLYDVLSLAAAAHVLPRATANGQRALLDQMKDKGRQATPVAERPAPAEPEPDVTKMSESAYQAYLIQNAEKVARGG